MNARAEIQAMHAIYCRLTGFQLSLDMAREHAWFEVRRRGVGPAELGVLIGHLQRQIKAGNRNPGCLKFRNLVGNPDYLEEDLAEAKAQARRPRVDPGRASVLQATHRPAAAEPPPARPAGAVMPPEEVQRHLKAALEEARKRIGR